MGAITIDRIGDAARRNRGWNTILISSRGLTANAQGIAARVARAVSPNDFVPLAFAEAPDFLARYLGNSSQEAGVPSRSCQADLLVTARVTPSLLERLAKDTEQLEQALREGDPRFLEELVAANWRRAGYEVQLVTRINAGGPDVIATKRDSPVPIRILTSCKWRGPGYSIKVSDIAELIAWFEMIQPANAGLLATNSRLQTGALELTQRFHRVKAIDGDALIAWTQQLWA